jgi:hypothetical protein
MVWRHHWAETCPVVCVVAGEAGLSGDGQYKHLGVCEAASVCCHVG